MFTIVIILSSNQSTLLGRKDKEEKEKQKGKKEKKRKRRKAKDECEA
jgi:hypothetical protein